MTMELEDMYLEGLEFKELQRDDPEGEILPLPTVEKEKVIQFGKTYLKDKATCISLCFLITTPKSPKNYPLQIQQEKFFTNSSHKLGVKLINAILHSIHKGAKEWTITWQVLCALYLMGQLKAIKNILPKGDNVSRDWILRHLEDRESDFIDRFTLNLFKFCDSLKRDEGVTFFKKFDLNYDDPIHEFFEISMIQLIKAGFVQQDQPLKESYLTSIPYEAKKHITHAVVWQKKYVDKGLVLIINQRDFHDVDGTSHPREGTDKDVENLDRTFRKFGGTIKVEANLTRDQMFGALKDFTIELDKGEYNYAVLFILTHGQYNVTTRTDELFDINWTPIAKDEIEEAFLCGSVYMRDHPKLMFVQACRSPTNTDQISKQHKRSHSISAVNYMSAYSTVRMCESVRTATEGSVFVYSLCEMLTNHGDKDFSQWMAKTVHQVKVNYPKQFPIFNYQLFSETYFKRCLT